MKYIIYIILMLNILLSSPITLAKSLENQKISLHYYYWQDENDIYYLGKKRGDGAYSVWIYTKKRKWKPFHNANSFDGFPKVGKMYNSVSFKDGYIMLETNEPKDKNNSTIYPPKPFDFNITKAENKIKKIKVDYYFWLNKDGIAFLLRDRDTKNPSIWHYTLDRKWMPLYNAQSFDNFSGIKNIFDSVKLDTKLSMVKVGKFVNYLQKDFKLKLSSDSLGDDNSLTSYFLMKTPHFSWTYDDKYKTIHEAFILQIAKEDGTLIYSTLLSKDANNIKEGRSVSDSVLALPMNSFCEKEYINTNLSDASKISYIASIYAVYDISITNKETCIKDISKEENYLAKDSLNLFLWANSTVKVNGSLFYKDNKYMQGNISFTFKNVELKRPIKDIKNYINMTNLPTGFSVSKDLKISHKIIDRYTLSMSIEQTNITLEHRTIGIEFLDTLFNKTPQKMQKATINIKDYKAPPSEEDTLPGLNED